jgi:hypothetical protein
LNRFDINTERGKLKNVIVKRIASSNIHFFYRYRDTEVMYMDILTVLSVFPIISINQIEELADIAHRYVPRFFQLEKYGCIKVYDYGDPEYDTKKLSLPNLYEKGMIIESMLHIEELSKGAVFDMKKWRKIALAQLRRKTKTPYRINNKAIILEITDKGRLLLEKYVILYSTFFNIPVERFTINKNILGLFNKSVDELKKIVQQYDILALMAQNVINRNAVNGK